MLSLAYSCLKLSGGHQLAPHTLGSYFYMEEQEEKEGNRVETIVKVAILVWSASMLTLSYYEPPSGKKIVDFDPTFIASIFSGSLAAFNVQVGKKKNGNGNAPKIVDNSKNKVGIK